MRRVWIVLAGTMVLAVAMSGAGVAYARTDSRRASASSCSDLVKKYSKANKSSSAVDFTKPENIRKAFKSAGKYFNELASSGPSSLRSAFKHAAAVYGKLSKADFSNQAALGQQFSGLGRSLLKDFEKIGKYFAQKCNVTIPSSGATPTT